MKASRLASIAVAVTLACACASNGPGSGHVTEQPGASPLEILALSDKAMAEVGPFRDERMYWDVSVTPPRLVGDANISEYDGLVVRGVPAAPSSMPDDCAWISVGPPPLAHRATRVHPGDVTLGGRDQANGRDAIIVKYHFSATDQGHGYTIWRTEWVDAQSYRLLRLEQDSSDRETHLVDIFVYDSQLVQFCPSARSIPLTDFAPRAIHGGSRGATRQ